MAYKNIKPVTFITIILFFASCKEEKGKPGSLAKKPSVDTIIKHDTVFYSNDNKDWQVNFGLTHDPDEDTIWGKPVKFYISNPKCSPIAIDFYQGQFRPIDNHTTGALLDLVTTNDNALRPFYRWCLSKTIQIQDGALAEYTGTPARSYAEKFPKEFFAYMDHDTTKEKYSDWASAISYSGFYEGDDFNKPAEVRKRMINTMKRNCNNCSDTMIKRIEKFATDCFPSTDQ